MVALSMTIESGLDLVSEKAPHRTTLPLRCAVAAAWIEAGLLIPMGQLRSSLDKSWPENQLGVQVDASVATGKTAAWKAGRNVVFSDRRTMIER